MIVKATRQDAQNLSELAMRSKAHWGYDESFMTQAQDELTYDAFDLDEHITYMAVDHGLTTGFYQLIHINDATVELDALFIAPQFIGQGLGERLFNHAVSQARESGYKAMSILSDPFAEGFYLKLGCVKVGEKPSLSIPGRFLPALVFAL